MPSKPLLIATALLAAACSTAGASPSAQADVDPDVVGTWVATTGDPVGVVAVFNGDGTFTWSNDNTHGTYEADGSTLTFSYPADNRFCPEGTLIWEYEISGDTLTSDLVGGLCPGGVPWEEGPPSPDWIFERQ
jgi:hypothetical protein